MAELIPTKTTNFKKRFASFSSGDIFSAVLIGLSPITSIILLDLQGTTPAFILIALSLLVPVYGTKKYFGFISLITITLLFHLLFLTCSLIGYFFSAPDFTYLVEIRRVFIVGQLRLSHLTQSAYFLLALAFCLYIYHYFKEIMIKWAFFGILCLLAYGLYEFVFFALFGYSGDILSNRVFGDIVSTGREVDYLNGSLVQGSLLFGDQFMRLKSLTGEPSMYSLTTVPFFIYAYKQKMTKIHLPLLLGLFLTQSTTTIIGIFVAMIFLHYRDNKYTIIAIPLSIIFFVLLYFTLDPFYEAANKLLFEKLSSESGVERMDLFFRHAAVIADGNLVRLFFGVGFGTLRSTDMFSNIVSNTGILGFIMYSIIILLPVFAMGPGKDRRAIQAALISIYVMEMLTVSEYSYLPPWFFVALGYVRWLKPELVSASRQYVVSGGQRPKLVKATGPNIGVHRRAI